MKRTALFLLVVTLMAAMLGCAGGAIDFNTWAGSYSGSGTLDNDKVGTIALTVDTEGLVSGTLDVTGADGTDTNFKFTPGSYPVTGSITSTGGDYEVHGNVPTFGDFFIRGKFPTDSSNKTYTVVTATSATYPVSQHYTGTLSRN